MNVNLREWAMAALPGAVADGRCDIGYIRSPMTLPDGVEAVRLDSEGFVLALAHDSWLLGLKAITCEYLENETFILPEQISGTCMSPPRAVTHCASARSRAGWWLWWPWCRWGRGCGSASIDGRACEPAGRGVSQYPGQ